MADTAGDPRAAPPTPEPTRVSWHALPLAEAFGRLDSRPEGLTSDEAQERLERFGPNRPRPPSGGLTRACKRAATTGIIRGMMPAATEPRV